MMLEKIKIKKIKNLALTTAVSSLISSTFLSGSAYALGMGGQSYITVGAGAMMLNKSTAQLWEYDNMTQAKVKFKGKTSPLLQAGFGGYIDDHIRIEALISAPFIGDSKGNTKGLTDNSYIFGNDDNNQPIIGQADIKRYYKSKHRAFALHAKASYEAFDISDIGSFYVTGGVGISNITSKMSYYDRAVEQGVANGVTPKVSDFHKTTVSAKKKLNFAWLAGVGANIYAAPGVKFAVEYNYQDYDKTSALKKDITQNKFFDIPSQKIRGHVVMCKLEFDI